MIREIAKDKEKIKKIAEDMAEHFKEVVEPTELKAMIVTIDREACVLFKEAIDEHLPEDYSEVVMTPDYQKKIVRDYFQKLHERYDMKRMRVGRGGRREAACARCSNYAAPGCYLSLTRLIPYMIVLLELESYLRRTR